MVLDGDNRNWLGQDYTWSGLEIDNQLRKLTVSLHNLSKYANVIASLYTEYLNGDTPDDIFTFSKQIFRCGLHDSVSRRQGWQIRAQPC